MKTQIIKQAVKATFIGGNATNHQLLISFLILASIVFPLIIAFGHNLR